MNDLAEMSYLGTADFAALTDKGKEKVQARIAAVQRILKAAYGQVGQAENREAKLLGICPSAMRRLVKEYELHEGDWKSLIYRSGEKQDGHGNPPGFVDFWKGLVEDNQRVASAAHEKLKELYWGRTFEFPGYTDVHGTYHRPKPSRTSPDGLPRGWSYKNLILPHNMPTTFELVLARQGDIAAGAHLLQTFTTRVGLHVGEYLCFDDLQHDKKLTLPWQRSTGRALELACGDIASACKIKYGLKPTLERDDGTRQMLCDANMRFLMAGVLCGHGVYNGGFHLMVEHGTARITPEVEAIIRKYSPVPMDVMRSGIAGGYVLAGGFPGLTGSKDANGKKTLGFYAKGLGNFRFKGMLESNHRIVHDRTADRELFPGQMGKDRDHSPEALVGEEREWDHLFVACQSLPPGTFEAITPLLVSFDTFKRNLRVIDRLIQGRTNHRMEGWRECGYMQSEFRMGLDENAPWQSTALIDAMPEDQQNFILEFLDRNRDYVRERRMSPWEVAQRGARDLVRFPLWMVPELLGRAAMTVRTVKDTGEFVFKDRDLGDDEVRYLAMARTPDGQMRALNGTFNTWFNEFDPAVLFVCEHEPDGIGGFIGVCPLRARVARPDQEALIADWAEKRKAYYSAIQGPRRRGLRKLAEDARRMANNTDVIRAAEAPVIEPSAEEREIAAYVAGAAPEITVTETPAPAPAPKPARPNFGLFLPK